MIRLGDQTEEAAFPGPDVGFNHCLHFGPNSKKEWKTGLNFADGEWTRRRDTTFFEMNRKLFRQTGEVDGDHDIPLRGSVAQSRCDSADRSKAGNFVR